MKLKLSAIIQWENVVTGQVAYITVDILLYNQGKGEYRANWTKPTSLSRLTQEWSET